MVGSYLLQMNLRFGRGADGSGHGSTSAGVGHGQEGHGENGRENANGESQDAPRLAPLPPPPPPPPLMTQAEMMVELLASRRETARVLELMAQAVGGLTRGGPSGNGGNGGGARGLERPCSYQDFLKTNPPTFTPTAEPLDVEH
jgi:hypothetical protein